MVSQTRTLNSVQTIPQKKVAGTIVDITTVWYTVPAGKKAIVTQITGQLVAYGAGTTAGIALGGLNLINFIFGTDALNTLKSLQNVVLVAGDTIQGQSNGANPTVNFTAAIQESPL